MVHQLFSKNLSQCPMPTLLTKAFKVVDGITFDFDELHWTRDDVLNLGNRSEAVECLFPPQLQSSSTWGRCWRFDSWNKIICASKPCFSTHQLQNFMTMLEFSQELCHFPVDRKQCATYFSLPRDDAILAYARSWVLSFDNMELIASCLKITSFSKMHNSNLYVVCMKIQAITLHKNSSWYLLHITGRNVDPRLYKNGMPGVILEKPC